MAYKILTVLLLINQIDCGEGVMFPRLGFQPVDDQTGSFAKPV